MKILNKIFIFTFVALWLMLQANTVVSQEHYSTYTGTVVGIQKVFKKWLYVKSDKDELVINFRIGKDTVYTPHRYPYPGEKVKVEYLTNRGVDVAYRVTILGGPK